MKNIISVIVLTLVYGFSKAQTVEELYNNQNFSELVKFADQADSLSTEELYCVGYGFFQLENDKKAIEIYDKAIAKGLDEDYIYLYKGLSLRFDKQPVEAIKNFRTAVSRNPNSQKNYTELANSFYFQEKYDSALVYFYKARELDFELGDPYYKLPHILHVQRNFKKALEEYRISASLIDKDDPTYLEILKSIGQLEYTVFKQHDKAIKAYSEIISIMPKRYDLYPKLIKAYYGNKNFSVGDSLFQVMKKQYEKGALPEEYQKYGSVAIDEYEWNGRKVTTYRYFKEAKETLDIMYKIFLLSEDEKSVDRTLMTEKTIQLGEDGAKHLLCEREKDGTHRTYSYGWSTDEIDYASLKKSVILVLEKKLDPAASSNFIDKE